MPRPTHCAHCYDRLPPQHNGRPRRFCSDACRRLDYEAEYKRTHGMAPSSVRYWNARAEETQP